MARKKKEPKVAEEVELVELEGETVEPDAPATPTATTPHTPKGIDHVANFKARQKAEINGTEKTLIKVENQDTVLNMELSPYVEVLTQDDGKIFSPLAGSKGMLSKTVKQAIADGDLVAGSLEIA